MKCEQEYDVAVIGAGPAGLAAATAAFESGARVVCLDSNDQPGGQYWRHRPESSIVDTGDLHHDWAVYLKLRARFDDGMATGRVDYFPSSHVWMVERESDAHFTLRTTSTSQAGPDRQITPAAIRARKLILCTGGYDRQVPIPGWDLPGVMAAGGIQAHVKSNRTLPGKRFVIGGTGPFLLPVAANIAEAGGTVLGVCESSDLSGWLPHIVAAAKVPSKGLEGATYARIFLRHRIPYRTRTAIVEMVGTDHVEAVITAKLTQDGRRVRGSERRIDNVDAVGLGWGFTPQLELPMMLGAATTIDRDGSLIAIADHCQQSSVPGAYLAGEVSGVGGWALAVLEGETAGRLAAESGTSDTSSASGSDEVRRNRRTAKKIRTYRAFAHAMHAAHPLPEHWADWLTPDTTVCRCEEVTVEDIGRAREELEATNARTVKAMTRAGMGWCQSKVCGYAVSCLANAEAGGVADIESLRSGAKRPISIPVPLSELIALEEHATSLPQLKENS